MKQSGKISFSGRESETGFRNLSINNVISLILGKRDEYRDHIDGEVEISLEQLEAVGIDPKMIGWVSLEKFEEESKEQPVEKEQSEKGESDTVLTHVDIAVADKQNALVPEDISGVRAFFRRLKEKLFGRGND